MMNIDNYIELEIGSIFNLKQTLIEKLIERKEKLNYVLTLINKKDRTQILSILIDQIGAQAIAVEIEKMIIPVQTIASVFQNVLDFFEIKLDYILITEIDEKGYYKSKVKLTNSEKSTELNGRTTDLIILALKHKSPIYIQKEEFDKLVTK